MGSGTRATLVFAGGLLFTAAIGMATQYNFIAVSLGAFGSVLFALREGFTGTQGTGGAEKNPTRWLWLVASVGLVLLTLLPVLGAFSSTIVTASSGGGGGGASPPPTGAAVTCSNPCIIVIRNSLFGSSSQLQNGNGYVVVKAGTVVKWENRDNTQHTSTSSAPTPLWDSGILNPGQDFSFTFNTPGSFPYICNVHPMTGTIVVVS